MNWLAFHRYELIVFITGMAVLIIEVTATRILSPYYGNTIYTISSVIGVILGALSAGYWRGGIEADEHPDIGRFYRIIWKSGKSLLLLFFFVVLVLPIGGNFFSLETGPLLWSIVLFFPSSYFMGKLSPFAITLAKREHPEKGLGHITGAIFFWSTAGSIVGTLSAGFLFIPHVGIRTILFCTTLLILLLGGIGEIGSLHAREKRKRFLYLLFYVFILWLIYSSSQLFQTPGQLLVRDGTYEQLTVFDSQYAGKPARFFLQDQGVSGGGFIESSTLAFDYTKYYALYKLAVPHPKHVLFIGGGVYSMPKALHEKEPESVIDVVDIEPDVKPIAQTYFGLPDSPQIITHIADGRRFVVDSTTTYDVIFSDVYYTLYSIPAHFTTKEFFAAAKAKLSPGGIFLANIIGSTASLHDSLLLSEIHTMHEIFPNMAVLAVDSATSTSVQNFILVGINGDRPLPIESLPAPNERDEVLRTLPEHLLSLDTLPWRDNPILTDDFAPVEHLVSNILHDFGTETEHLKTLTPPETAFSGQQALATIKDIVALGSRAIGTSGHEVLKSMIEKKLHTLADDVSVQSWEDIGPGGKKIMLENIIARFQPENPRRIIVGTHYDSIAHAYRDTKDPNAYMPGANNSASGVATMIELARVLQEKASSSNVGVDLVFFDGEEGHNALGEGDDTWSPLGSTYFADHLETLYPRELPTTGIILDMVCDKNLTISPEQFSKTHAASRVKSFWSLGKQIAPLAFNNDTLPIIGDDHTALNLHGIPSFLVIDFDYAPWFNTTEDTPDKCSAESLESVGRTVEAYIFSR